MMTFTRFTSHHTADRTFTAGISKEAASSLKKETPMARFTLSIADDVAAQLDAWAAENNLNRSQAAEHIFRSVFQGSTSAQAQTDDAPSEELEESSVMLDGAASVEDQLLEMRDYMTILYSRQESLRNYVMATTDYSEAPFGMTLPRTLPAPPWVQRAQS